MSTIIHELQTRLAELEAKRQEFEENVRRRNELLPRLDSAKKRMLGLKEKYDTEAVGYVETLIELEEVNSTIKYLGSQLEIEHVNSLLVDIPSRYGYLGNLGESNVGLVIHESIAPSVRGMDMWRLIKRRKPVQE